MERELLVLKEVTAVSINPLLVGSSILPPASDSKIDVISTEPFAIVLEGLCDGHRSKVRVAKSSGCPTRKCPGIRADRSPGSVDMGVKGREFKHAYI